jgi:hypothetical protein
MTKKHTTPGRQPITEFAVDDQNTLTMANAFQPVIRAEFDGYESFKDCTESPAKLAAAIDECQPLAWAVHEIYVDAREEMESELEDLSDDEDAPTKQAAALKARLQAMPVEAEKGAKDWLLSMPHSEFEQVLVPPITRWFNSEPDWGGYEDDFVQCETPVGRAFDYFNALAMETLDAIGVVVVEGECPGSTYFAAELTITVEAANKAAEEAGIPVRFRRAY